MWGGLAVPLYDARDLPDGVILSVFFLWGGVHGMSSSEGMSCYLVHADAFFGGASLLILSCYPYHSYLKPLEQLRSSDDMDVSLW